MLLLLSNGIQTAQGKSALKKVIKDDGLQGKRILLFLGPYRYPSLMQRLYDACIYLGFSSENIVFWTEDSLIGDAPAFDYVYVTDGNCFRILRELKKYHLINLIRDMVKHGTCYIGASAGAVIAGGDIAIAKLFDDYSNEDLSDLSALALFDGTVSPHCSKKHAKIYQKEAEVNYRNIYNISEGKGIRIKSRWE